MNDTVFMANPEGNSTSFLVGQLSVLDCAQKLSIVGLPAMQIWVPESFKLLLEERLVALSNSGPLGFFEAKAACETMGGQLPMIRNQKEYQDVTGIQAWQLIHLDN